MARPNLITKLRDCSSRNWSRAGKWLLYTSFGFLPIVFGVVIVLFLSKQPVPWEDFVVHGDFAIYAATLIATAAQLISRDSESGIFVHSEVFNWIVLVAMIFAIMLYAIVRVADFVHVTYLNHVAVIRSSEILLGFSIALAFLVVLLDDQRSNPNVPLIRKHSEEALSKDFDKLVEENGAGKQQ